MSVLRFGLKFSRELASWQWLNVLAQQTYNAFCNAEWKPYRVVRQGRGHDSCACVRVEIIFYALIVAHLTSVENYGRFLLEAQDFDGQKVKYKERLVQC